ncbi:MAG: metallophosphoesterase, partial [Gammaproteobacteria bacterium]|nr:metallophosphoesterase [Gammaproteobacteria bacterium]
TPPASVTCDPNDPGTFSECGSVLVALTDADGDFLNYTVDVVSLTLETANGRVVETLPNATRVNFTDYVDLTELVSIANVPPAIYVAGTIKLNYGDAEIYVEADGAAKEAVVKDLKGNVLTETELKIMLPEQRRLVVTRGRPALLQLDFDLAASHKVDIGPSPADAISEQFIVAEVLPVDEKDIRVRGPLVSVNEDAMTYTVALRPFRDRDGDFGRFVVHVTDTTAFEVDDVAYAGVEGLRALSAAGAKTPTVAKGVLNVAEREFTASLVLAGSSVPGIDRDAVIGNVIKRDGNFLTVRGATIVPSDRRAHFHDDVVVEVGPDTKVFKDWDRRTDLGIDAISIGQRVTIRGNQPTPTTDALAPQILFDATEGFVRMHVTKLAGIVNTVGPLTTDITLQSIDRRRVQIFDFSGTGGDEDADPDNYEISTGNLTLADFSAGKPIVARGFPTAFGTAPPDFVGRTVIDYTDVRSALGIGWGANGSAAPFVSIGPDGIIIDRLNMEIGQRHYVKQGPVLIDLTALDSDTTIVPRESDRQAFYIKTADSLRMYADFGEFADDLTESLDGSTTARSMHAHGKYNVDTNVFTAYKIGVYLLEP